VDLSAVASVEVSAGLVRLAEGCLFLLPVAAVRVTLDAYDVQHTCRISPVGAAGTPVGVDGGGRAPVVLGIQHREEVLGSVELLAQEDPLTAGELDLARSLAGLAARGFASRRRLEEARGRARVLQEVLDDAVVVEQAKGMLAEVLGGTPGRAEELLRAEVQRSGRTLPVLAREIIAARTGPQGRRWWPSWVQRR
jgi:GAF domain-containing protein